MDRPVTRIIKFAMFANGIGPISAEELVVAPTVRWELWRSMITDAYRETPRRHLARCMRCQGPIYIKTRAVKGEKLPLFAHYAGANADCPWFTGKPMAPDDARAAQYGGAQESNVHRDLCNLIADLASADPRTEEVAVDAYLPPTANSFGRYPDVRVKWTGFAQLAIELQLSRTFQTEISARCGHYQREGMPLVWVLFGVDLDAEEIPQSFRDVLLRHRMNAFLIDQAAIDASREQQTLVLSCRLARPDGGFEPARQVRLDSLTFPQRRGLPYFEDRLTPVLVKRGQELRAPWFKALKTHNPGDSGTAIDTRPAEWDAAFATLYRATPGLQAWAEGGWGHKDQFAALVAVAFSVITYAQGKFTNYASAQDNVAAMLNSLLSGWRVGPYAILLRALIRLSSASDLLNGSVGEHIKRAISKHDGNLCQHDQPEWEALTALLPEIFSRRLRAELDAAGATPPWVAEIDGEDEWDWLYER
ncbi:DUF6035 family protein [Xanthobacter versatilis]|uniref:DUF6035 family protein n=1 Tax=Xanthobacter autotrophicus (strain ATCC BAA-1158 / Py2) TaxID=78245 RepID=UPI0037291FB2